MAESIRSSAYGGVFTRDEELIRFPEKFNGRAFNRNGDRVYNLVGYATNVWAKAIRGAAERATTTYPHHGAFVYVLSLNDRRNYVGMTSNPEQRMGQHLEEGTGGAKCLEGAILISVRFTPYATVQEAKDAERALYHQLKGEKGADVVRGAGNTRGFP